MIYFLAWLIYPILEAGMQGLFFKKWPTWFGKPFNPYKEPMYLRIIRGAAWFTWAIAIQYAYQIDVTQGGSLWFILITVSFGLCSFWLIFDPLLNYIRYKIGHLPKFDFFHSGSDFQSGFLDSLDEIESQNFYITAKIVALLISVIDVILFWWLY